MNDDNYLQNQQPPCVAWELVRSDGSQVYPPESTPRSGVGGWRSHCTWWTDSHPPPPRAGWDLTLSPPAGQCQTCISSKKQEGSLSKFPHCTSMHLTLNVNVENKMDLAVTIHIKGVKFEDTFPICNWLVSVS